MSKNIGQTIRQAQALANLQKKTQNANKQSFRPLDTRSGVKSEPAQNFEQKPKKHKKFFGKKRKNKGGKQNSGNGQAQQASAAQTTQPAKQATGKLNKNGKKIANKLSKSGKQMIVVAKVVFNRNAKSVKRFSSAQLENMMPAKGKPNKPVQFVISTTKIHLDERKQLTTKEAVQIIRELRAINHASQEDLDLNGRQIRNMFRDPSMYAMDLFKGEGEGEDRDEEDDHEVAGDLVHTGISYGHPDFGKKYKSRF